MTIPARGLNQIRTLAGRSAETVIPYRSYMQLSCLEMERVRRNIERTSASKRIAVIDARIEEIDRTKEDLLQAMAASGEGAPTHLSGSRLEPAPRRNTGGFKIRY